QVKHDIRLVIGVETIHVGFAGEVVFAAPGDDEMGISALAQFFDNEGSEKPGTAGDHDTIGMGEAHVVPFGTSMMRVKHPAPGSQMGQASIQRMPRRRYGACQIAVCCSTSTLGLITFEGDKQC